MSKWTQEEEDIVNENFGVKPIRVWRDQLPNRTIGAIRKKAQRMELYSDITCADFPPPRYQPELPKATDMTFNELWEATLNFQRMALELSTRLDPVNIYLDVDQPIGVGFLADAHIGSISTPLDEVRTRLEFMREQPWLYLIRDGDTIDNYLPTRHPQGMFCTMFPPELQKELVNTEDRIQAARRFYNGNVREYNNRCQMFPSSVIAGMFGFAPGEYFEVEHSGVRAPVAVDFNRA